MIDPPEVIAPRLKAIRKALGFKTQTAFAKRLGLEKNTYNPYEKGTRPLTFEAAVTMRKLWGIPLDFTFFGADADRMPAHILEKLDRAA
jgi:transcriptional regulator with XRE-family HTH domain